MNRPVSLALFVIGIVLVVMGANASDSLGSRLSRFFSGTPTDATIWLLIGGVLAVVVGVSGLARRTS